jgi:hypothetical protein
MKKGHAREGRALEPTIDLCLATAMVGPSFYGKMAVVQWFFGHPKRLEHK